MSLIAFMMIGLPGSGKSTWARRMAEGMGSAILSTDDYIQAAADLQGKTYRELWEDMFPEARKAVQEETDRCIRRGDEIIFDSTNLTRKGRIVKLAQLPLCYRPIAVVVATPPLAEWQHRLGNRPGKTIPLDVMARMIEEYEPPSIDEGFKEIWSIAQ